MVSICRNNSVNSFFGLPPPMEEDHFSQAFHQTLCVPSPPQSSPSFPPNKIFNPLKPIRVIESFDEFVEFPLKSAGNFDGIRRISDGIDLMSCTENLGLESSDEMISSFDDLGIYKNKKKNNNNEESSLSSSSSSSLLNSSSKRCVFRRGDKRVSKGSFPPPLMTLDENGRRNFTLESVRKNGRLQIAEVRIERPEVLRATRENGRLRLNLIQTVSSSDDDDDDDDDDDNQEGEEEETEERERKVPAAGSLRRCYDHHHRRLVWGPHQNRCVTTI